MKLIEPKEFPSLLDFTKQHLPHTSLVHLWLQVRVKKYAPPVGPEFCYVDIWPDPKSICTVEVLPEMDGYENVAVFSFWSDWKDATEIQTFFAKVDEDIMMNTVAKANRAGRLMGGIAEYHVQPFLDFFQSKGEFKCRTYPHFTYWIPPELQAELVKWEIEAPEGYYFDKIRLDEAELVDSLWRFRSEGSIASIQRRIKYFPNVCLRANVTDELASFELVHDEDGFMNHLYTVGVHRRKGLARKVEEKLAQTLIRQDHLPFKYVVDDNEEGKIMSDASPWWKDFGYKGFYIECIATVCE